MNSHMGKGRLEAFSDGVLAVIITIMVLELRPPHEPTLGALLEVVHPFFAYVLSFVYVGIYWNNHHHLFQSVEHVNGRILWANNLLLFCLSLVPFSTSWMGETDFALVPTVAYGLTLFLPAFAYLLLSVLLVRLHGDRSRLALAIGRGLKEWLSLLLYILGIAGAFLHPYVAFAFYMAVAAIWFIPDRRIERQLETGR
ncbi:MAG TPA: TMEM175 family protein [Devosia sp.]|nr:TMEM175 family protein [Devosia sp.]